MTRRSPLHTIAVATSTAVLASALAAAPPATAVPPAVGPSGTVVAWGSDGDDQSSPPAGLTDVVDVAGGHTHTVALRADGTVVSWGGDTDVLTPPADLTDAIDVGAGAYWSAAVREDGTVVAWGDNEWDQLSVPDDLDDAVEIDLGGSHGLALRSDGSMAIWGGDTPGGRPTLPPGLDDDVVAFSAGGSHDLFVLSDGTVVGHGFDAWGQATPPAGLDDVVAVSAGAAHSLALRADGTVVAWGLAAGGRLDVPEGLDDAVAVEAGLHHSLALRSDGTVVAWGENSAGQSDVPEGLDDVFAISAGSLHSLALVRADERPPVVTVPGDLDVDATSSHGARVDWSATAHDERDGAVPVTCSAEPGALFDLGRTTVTCSATDAAGNTGTASFMIRVTYSWSGFLRPLRHGMQLRAGRVVAVRFRLTGASAGIRDAKATLWYARVTDGAVGKKKPARGLSPRAWGRSGTYLGIWRTRGIKPGRYVLGLDLGDGVRRTVRFRVLASRGR